MQQTVFLEERNGIICVGLRARRGCEDVITNTPGVLFPSLFSISSILIFLPLLLPLFCSPVSIFQELSTTSTCLRPVTKQTKDVFCLGKSSTKRAIYI